MFIIFVCKQKTAYEMLRSLLGKQKTAYEMLRSLVGSEMCIRDRFHIDNHNRLLTRYPGAIGIKNGYTAAAKASLVAAARRGDHGVIVTLLGAESDVWDEAARLLDWGFDAESRAAAGVGTLVPPRLAGALDSADRAAESRAPASRG